MYSLKNQTGDFLIEAMIGTLITALVSLGTLVITSKVLLSQEEMMQQESIVTALREQLYNNVAAVQCPSALGAPAPAVEVTSKIPGKTPGAVIDLTAACNPLPITFNTATDGGVATARNLWLPRVGFSAKTPLRGTEVIYELGAGGAK